MYSQVMSSASWRVIVAAAISLASFCGCCENENLKPDPRAPEPVSLGTPASSSDCREACAHVGNFEDSTWVLTPLITCEYDAGEPVGLSGVVRDGDGSVPPNRTLECDAAWRRGSCSDTCVKDKYDSIAVECVKKAKTWDAIRGCERDLGERRIHTAAP